MLIFNHGADAPTVTAALWVQPLKKGRIQLVEIRREFGGAVAAALDGLTPPSLFSLDGGPHRRGDIEAVFQLRGSEKLLRLYQGNATDAWPWIEDIVAYANGKICQALLRSGRCLQRQDMVQAGLRSLEWLIAIQTDPKGHFVPVGNNGWYPRSGEKARFDQQPIEALDVIEACREAYEATHETKWLTHAQRSLEWFLGRNDLNAPLYDHRTGGCCDGLQADGPNRNQGAESSLVCFLSLLHLHQLRSRQITIESMAETEGELVEERIVPSQPAHGNGRT